MHPQAAQLWRHPRWLLSVLLAGLGVLGPFSIDTYLPAFEGIARSTGATPVQLQQTLSSYLAGFALMNLFHGALSDSLGRRPVVMAGMIVFTIASAGCALSQSIESLILFRALQGMSAGAGMVVSRAVIRDLYPPADAQRIMSQVTLFFGIAPAIAPLIGGYIYVHADWHLIFWFLTAVGLLLTLVNWKMLPESLPPASKQEFAVRPLMQGYASLLKSRRFLLLVLASGIPFNSMFMYVLAAPEFLGRHLGLEPTQFFWLFLCTIGGIMGGAFWSGRVAGKMKPPNQIRRGFTLMVAAMLVNLAINAFIPQHAIWSLPVIGVFSLGWAFMVPVVTLMVLEVNPDRRGMASSLQSAIAAAANAVVAGALVPLVMHSLLGLAVMSCSFLLIGLVAWQWVRKAFELALKNPPIQVRSGADDGLMLRLFFFLLLLGLTPARADEPGDDLRKRLAERLATKQEPTKLVNRRGAREPAPKPAPTKPWGYTGEGAPEHWGELSPANKLCAIGTRQSPIDIRDTLRVDLEPIQFDYKSGGFSIIDTGRTVEVHLPKGSGLSVGQRRYELLQFQFHRPAGERINGRAFDMAAHLVHRDAQGKLAVLALLIQAGEADHPVIQRVWGHIPLEKHQLVSVAQTIDLNELLPAERGYFTYMGSMPTPPCKEDVLWLVMREPVRLSAQQIEVFARLYPMNSRPLQPAGGRIVKESL